MPLDPLVLDTLSWTDMTATIRRRIPAASAGQWTLHAPVDPGITLLELFSYLIEQRVYWMDQIPDTLIRAALALLGDASRAAQPASAIFQLSSKLLGGVPNATRIELLNTAPPLIFTTDSEIGLVRVGASGIRVIAGGVDRTLDLAQGKTAEIFPADCSAAQVTIACDFAAPLPASPIALLFQVNTPGDIPSQQSPNAVTNVPPPATISWMYSDASGRWKAIPNLDDGTASFRRTGIVRFTAPADWAAGASGYVVSISVEQASFSSPVILAAPVIANVTIAHHRDHIDSGDSLSAPTWMPLPGQTLPIAGLPIENTVALQIVDPLGAWQAWTPVQDFGPYGPGDQVFIVDRTPGVLRFGDGLTGRIPRPDANHQIRFRLQYDSGGGQAGNLGGGLKWRAADSTVDLCAVNVTAAAGGAESETLQAAIDRAGEELREVTRAVTGPDCEAIVLGTPGVGLARAHASIGKNPTFPCTIIPGALTVYTIPHSTDPAPQPDPGALQSARARLDAARLIGSEMFVEGPRYRQITLLVDVQGNPTDPKSLRNDVIDGLRAFLDPLTGGDDGTGWPFGDAVSPSALMRQAQNAAGDRAQIQSVAIGIDGADATQSCSDVTIGSDDLVELSDVAVQLSAGPAFTGGLR